MEQHDIKITTNIFLKGNTFDYPLESLKAGYLETLESRINEYTKRFDDLSNNSLSLRIYKEKPQIVKTGKQICDVIKIYLSGNSENAYRKFSSVLEENRSSIENLAYDVGINREYLYRTRLSETQVKAKKEIFHIPFDQRHLVDTQRYSIAGVPCLYFGNTIYGCWLELDKPDINKLYISKFRNVRPVKILDLAMTFKTLSGDLRHPNTEELIYSNEKIEAFFILYPLLLACSFNKKNNNAKFNVEYIIPNMLLQWVANNKSHIDGIRYFSTKKKHETYQSIGVNSVFPPKKNRDSLEGFCPDLKNTFKFTAPASWSMIDALPLRGEESHMYHEKIRDDELILQNVDEILDLRYGMTKFYEAELKIDQYFEFLKLDDKHRPEHKRDLGIF